MKSGQITIEALFSIIIVLLATGFAIESQNTFFEAAKQHTNQQETLVEFEKTAIILDTIAVCGKGCFLKIKTNLKENNLNWSVCEKNRVCDKTGKPIRFTVATSATNQKNIKTYCPYEAEVFC